MLVNIAVDESWLLGVLSSRFHRVWALAMGGRLGIGNDPRYNKTRCFETFAFPSLTNRQKQRIGDLAEQIDEHRKQQLAAHPRLTLTGIYNVLEKRRVDDALAPNEKTIYEQGLVGVLAELHEELDVAVAAAYGWTVDLTDEQVLDNLLALNMARAAEERIGLVKWLRPAYQQPDGATQATQAEAALDSPQLAEQVIKVKLPTDLPARFASVRHELSQLPAGGDVEAVAEQFHGAKRKTISGILDTLAGLGQVVREDTGKYVL